MKYFLTVLLLLACGLGATVLMAPDSALAYVDHRLIDVSRLTGNPPFLLEARNTVHSFRYARSSFQGPVKMRIARKGDPARVLPAATPVISPATYQFGRMPPAFGKAGVLGPTTAGTPQAPPVTPVTYVEDFENKFAGNVNHDFALGWTGYTVWGEPTSDGEFTTRHSGNWAQKVSGYASFRGGIYRQFNTTPGTSYSIKVFAHLYVLGGGAVHIGVDPYGGTDPNAPTVVWFPQATRLGEWMELNASGPSVSSVMTVFLEGYSLLGDNTNAYFDDFSLQTFLPI